MGEQAVGRVVGMAVRTPKMGPMKLIQQVMVSVDGGLEGDLPSKPDRGITFLSNEQWAIVQRELDVNLPWHTRRANVLVEGLDLASLIGKTVRVGPVEVRIKDETRPCDKMDALHPGLQTVLRPNCRAGVHGRVTRTGRVAVGDTVTVVPDDPV